MLFKEDITLFASNKLIVKIPCVMGTKSGKGVVVYRFSFKLVIHCSSLLVIMYVVLISNGMNLFSLYYIYIHMCIKLIEMCSKKYFVLHRMRKLYKILD